MPPTTNEDNAMSPIATRCPSKPRGGPFEKFMVEARETSQVKANEVAHISTNRRASSRLSNGWYVDLGSGRGLGDCFRPKGRVGVGTDINVAGEVARLTE